MQLSKAFLAVAVVASSFPSLSNGQEDAALCESMLREHAECNNEFYICNEAFEACADDKPVDVIVNATTNVTTELCEVLVCLDNGTYYSLEDDAQPPSLEDDAATNGTVTGNGTFTGGNGTSSLEDDIDNPSNGTASLEDDTNGNGTSIEDDTPSNGNGAGGSMEDDSPTGSGGSSGGSSANSKTSQAPTAFSALGMVATAVFALAAGLSMIV